VFPVAVAVVMARRRDAMRKFFMMISSKDVDSY
jgi:hypothetical protein